MNAANEILVQRFLHKNIAWSDISSKLETLMMKHSIASIHNLEDVLAIDQLAREEALKA
jgi:1-deoxy-D-xylulose-5-phosphate reductoisomerase